MKDSSEGVALLHDTEIKELLIEQVGELVRMFNLGPLAPEEAERIATIMLRRAEKSGNAMNLYTADEIRRVNQKGPLQENKRFIRELKHAYDERARYRRTNQNREALMTDSRGDVVAHAASRADAIRQAQEMRAAE